MTRGLIGTLTALTQCLGSFITFGDWGKNTSDFRRSAQWLDTTKPEFVVLLGDNFYENGVSSVNDEKWKLFDHIEPASPIFYAVLGNHDYRQSVTPQLMYHTVSEKWHMPSQYYYQHLWVGGARICGVFLDTHKFDSSQRDWAIGILQSPECNRNDTYRMVFTHYPIRTVGIFFNSKEVNHLQRTLRPVLEENRVHAYIAGHEHDMQLFDENGIKYMIAGSISDKSEVVVNHDEVVIPPIWHMVNTSGVLRFEYWDRQCIQYQFISTEMNNRGGILYRDLVCLDNDWRTSTSRSISSYTLQSLLVMCLLVYYPILYIFIYSTPPTYQSYVVYMILVWISRRTM
jgi:predicted phosphodiesterase